MALRYQHAASHRDAEIASALDAMVGGTIDAGGHHGGEPTSFRG
jgi:hypothetical protein